MRKQRWLSLALALAAAFAVSGAEAQRKGGATPAAAADTADEINMAIGENRIISARDVKNYSEGVPGIIDIKLTSDNSQFVINGRKAGSTTLLLIKADGTQNTLNINVFSRSPQAVEKELNQLLGSVSGVTVKRVGARFVIDGTVGSDADLKRVQHVATLYQDQVDSLVTMAGGGPVAGPAGPDKRFLIRIDFYFIQYDKNSSYAVGIGWPGSIGGAALQSTFTYDFLAGATQAATASLVNQPLPRLDIAAARGWAKVLKQATVITNNDSEANFSNGGEQNFSVNTGLTIGVQRISFGTDLTVLPHYDPGRRELSLKLVADVADLTASVGGASLPGRTTSKLTTNVSLKLGQSLVLSGIRTQSVQHNVGGLPLLSEIPILGLLFGSHSDNKLQTEGAVFVVPSVIEAIPTSAAELVDNAVRKFQNFDGDVGAVNAYDKRPGGGVGVPQ
jgi:pilus assembly protein CpaC